MNPARRSEVRQESNDVKSSWKPSEPSETNFLLLHCWPAGTIVKKWYLTQVDLEEMHENKARQRGLYHLRWWALHHVDATKRAMVACRFWPEIRELKSTGYLGARRVVRPHKAEGAIDRDDKLA